MLTNILLSRAVYKVTFRSILLSDAEGFHLIAQKKSSFFFSSREVIFMCSTHILCAVLTINNYNTVKIILELDWTANMFLTSLFSWEITGHQIMVMCKICPIVVVYFHVQKAQIYIQLTLGGTRSRWKEHFCNVVTQLILLTTSSLPLKV